MSRRSSYLAMLFCLLSLTRSTAAASSLHSLSPGRMASANFAIADFDGDQQADLATVQGSGVNSSQSQYWIHFQLTTGERQSFGITAPVGGLALSARDVNGDNIPDVIVSTSWLNRPVAILLNKGHGRFALVDPAEFPNVVWGAQNSRSLHAPPLHENGTLSLLRSSQNACEARNWLTRPIVVPDLLRQGFARDPALPEDALHLVRGPPSIHRV